METMTINGYDYYVHDVERCMKDVRPIEEPRFVRCKLGFVDIDTGLIWSSTTLDDQIMFSEAQDHAAEVSEIEGVKWRVPTVKELLSIVDYRKAHPATELPDICNGAYWSSTPCAFSEDRAWVVYFGSGYNEVNYKNHRRLVRCVVESGIKTNQ